ncbi:MAG: phosphatase PAP2 family protein [Actinobacteria bacterium]|nr:phosphatase PAP2 family protein [Actinomycetota bacterium]
MTRRRGPRGLGLAVRAGAGAVVAAAIVVPLVRKRLRIPAPVTIVATASGPLALAVLQKRSRSRDVVLFALQMWAFAVVHELPYDNPERLRARLRSRYPVRIDRAIGLGKLPGVRLQRALARLPGTRALDRLLAWTHWLWFFEPYLVLILILLRDQRRFPRAARQMAAVFDLGCAVYWLAPTAPPWWASEQGVTGEEVRRIMVEVGEPTWGRAWETMYKALGGNPWAAMPSLHFATSVMGAISLSETGRAEGAIGWTYAGTLGFGLVYLGEHYVTDLLAGALLVALVRRGEPLAEPAVQAVNRRLQRLERVAGR